MTIVTFKLNTFSMAQMVGLAPRVYFVPNGPAVIDSATDYLLASRRVEATLGEDGETFTVELVPAAYARPLATYSIVIEWLDSAGNFTQRDDPPWQLHVPIEDGQLGDMLNLPANPYWVFVGEIAPADPTSGTWWMDPLTGNLYEWS